VTFEDRVQAVLMLAVGSVAAAYSWSHVLDLAAAHGQEGWRAWAVALVTETAAVSGGLEVRRRRRAGESARWALAALGAAVVLQVAAQVARAEPSVWGVVLAVVPAVVFLLLMAVAAPARPPVQPPVQYPERPQNQNPYRKKKIGNGLRTAVFERDAYRCRACGTHRDLRADHIVPESKGGPTTLDNLQTLCAPCNSRKGTKPQIEMPFHPIPEPRGCLR
jgi:hypothetical protein